MNLLKNVLMFVLTSLLLFILSGTAQAQNQGLGIFQAHSDVGDVGQPGSVSYNSDSQTYMITGSGANMWFGDDQFHYVYRKLTGDFILRAHARFRGDGTDPHRKLGWIVRSSLYPNSPHVNASVHGDGLTALQFRETKGDSTHEIQLSVKDADVIQLERIGNTYIMSVARFGDTFTSDTLAAIELGDEVYAGLYVCSHSNDVAETAEFSNVRIIKPAGEDLVPYQDYLGSNLEIMEVESGHRKVIHQSQQSLQAPNWTPDGKRLLYNHNGLLYTFDLETNKPQILNTGFATNNNNDHVLTFDGTMLAISHHAEDADGASIIYKLPATGGTPERVTDKGPSYLHGWSPDNKFLVYTGERNGEYDIYKILADGGDEIRLTDTPGLDDGSEYSPDGKYIYFNSVRSGSMELWRMSPDGSNPEQLTDDEYNNWFPHVSPDGKWVAFLSYNKTVAPSDHPFYKQVYLRLMPIEGGEPKVIAYVYGGQGTINVPSWAPDSKRIAFVSNSGLVIGY